MHFVFYRVVLCRQAKRIPTHRVEHGVTAHAHVAAVYVGGYVALGVAHMQPLARGVREHVEHIGFWFIGGVGGFVEVTLDPRILPLFLYRRVVVFARHIAIYNTTLTHKENPPGRRVSLSILLSR